MALAGSVFCSRTSRLQCKRRARQIKKSSALRAWHIVDISGGAAHQENLITACRSGFTGSSVALLPSSS